MTLQEFFDGVDALHNKKVLSLNVETNSDSWRQSAVDFTSDLVLSSDGTTKPYTNGDFWTKVNAKLVQYGKLPGADNDSPAIADLVSDLSFPAAHNTIQLFADLVFAKVNIFFPEQLVVDAAIESDLKSYVGSPLSLALTIKTTGVVPGSIAHVALLTTLDGVNFTDVTLVDISTNGAAELLIDKVSLTNPFKIKVLVTGTVKIALFAKYKY